MKNRKIKLFSLFLVVALIFTSLPAQFMQKAMATEYYSHQSVENVDIYPGDIICMYQYGNKLTYMLGTTTLGEDTSLVVTVKGNFVLGDGSKKIITKWQVEANSEKMISDAIDMVRYQCTLVADPDSTYDEEEMTKESITGDSDIIGGSKNTLTLKLKHENYPTKIVSAVMENGAGSNFEISNVNTSDVISTDGIDAIQYKLKDSVNPPTIGETYEENIKITDQYGTVSIIPISQTIEKHTQTTTPAAVTASNLKNGQAEIKGVTTDMEYTKASDINYNPVTAAQQQNGIIVTATGDYYIRYKETGEFRAGDYIVVTVGKDPDPVNITSSGGSSSSHHHSSGGSSSSDSSKKAILTIGDSEAKAVIISKELYGNTVVGNSLNNIGLNSGNITSLYEIDNEAFKGNIAKISSNIVNSDGTSNTDNYVYIKCEKADADKTLKIETSSLKDNVPVYVYTIDALGNTVLIKTIDADTIAQNKDIVELNASQNTNYIVSDKKLSDSGNGVLKEGWNKIGNSWTYIKAGKSETGWYKDTDGTWYMLDRATGVMTTGWFKDTDGSWYYLELKSGKMLAGWVQDTDGKWYYLYANGSMAADTTVDGYYLGKSGAWIN